MKQMIKNHREIETLEDFIYYDKASGKCIATKIIPIDHTTVLSTMNNPKKK